MAVRLRNVTADDDESGEFVDGCDNALKPSARIMGGRIADKLGNRMGLRLSEERFLPGQPSLTLFEEQLELHWPVFEWRATRPVGQMY